MISMFCACLRLNLCLSHTYEATLQYYLLDFYCFTFYIFIYNPGRKIFVCSVRLGQEPFFLKKGYPIDTVSFTKEIILFHFKVIAFVIKSRGCMCVLLFLHSILFHWSTCLYLHQFHTACNCVTS